MPRKSRLVAAGVKPGKPAPDLLGVPLVRGAEAAPQVGLLVADDEEIDDDEPDRPIHEERPRPGQQQLPNQDRCDAEIHRIPDVAVEAADDELARRVYGGQRAAPAPRELPDAGPEQRGAEPDAHETDEMSRIEQVQPHPAEPEESPGHIAGDDARQQRRPDKAAEGQPDRRPGEPAGCQHAAPSLFTNAPASRIGTARLTSTWAASTTSGSYPRPTSSRPDAQSRSACSTRPATATNADAAAAALGDRRPFSEATTHPAPSQSSSANRRPFDGHCSPAAITATRLPSCIAACATAVALRRQAASVGTIPVRRLNAPPFGDGRTTRSPARAPRNVTGDKE